MRQIDPNLATIANDNLSLIKEDRLGKPISQAKNYLEYLFPWNPTKVSREIEGFIRYMKGLAR